MAVQAVSLELPRDPASLRLVGYVRVSVEEENPENQEFVITKWVAMKGYRLIHMCIDRGVSGGIPPLQRLGFSECLKLLEEGEADGLVVTSLDRIARSLHELSTVFKLFEEKGWLIFSVREEWLQNIDPRVRQLIVAILGWAGEMERELVRQRTREALQRLKAQGKRLGRPPKWNQQVRARIIDLVRRGIPLKDAASLVGIGYSTAKRYLSRDPEYLQAKAEAQLRGLRQRKHPPILNP